MEHTLSLLFSTDRQLECVYIMNGKLANSSISAPFVYLIRAQRGDNIIRSGGFENEPHLIDENRNKKKKYVTSVRWLSDCVMNVGSAYAYDVSNRCVTSILHQMS